MTLCPSPPPGKKPRPCVHQIVSPACPSTESGRWRARAGLGAAFPLDASMSLGMSMSRSVDNTAGPQPYLPG